MFVSCMYAMPHDDGGGGRGSGSGGGGGGAMKGARRIGALV